MLAYGVLLALGLGWFVLTGLFGSSVLHAVPRRIPLTLRLWLWLAGLYSLAFSALTSLVCLGILIGYSWKTLPQAGHGIGDLWYLFMVSVLPYVALALFGALAASAFTNIQPAIEAARSASELLRGVSSDLRQFQGIAIRVLETPVLVAAVVEVSRRPIILVTRGVLSELEPAELEAVYWHELGHALREHNGLGRIARFAATLLPWLPLARDAKDAVSDLCESIADQFAESQVATQTLASARAKFAF